MRLCDVKGCGLNAEGKVEITPPLWDFHYDLCEVHAHRLKQIVAEAVTQAVGMGKNFLGALGAQREGYVAGPEITLSTVERD